MSSDTETVIDQSKVRTLWHRVMFRGSELQVTVAAGGVGKILDFGLIADVRRPDGFSPGDIESVLVEFGKQLDATSAAIDKYMSETPNEELAASELPEGWIPFSEQDMQDWVEIPCDVIPLRGGDRND